MVALIALGGVLYCVFLIRSLKKDPKSDLLNEDKKLNELKESFTQSFGSMQKEIAKDMTGTLTRVDEKVLVFNQQIESLNKGQENFIYCFLLRANLYLFYKSHASSLIFSKD